jgi:hypothetical protein
LRDVQEAGRVSVVKQATRAVKAMRGRGGVAVRDDTTCEHLRYAGRTSWGLTVADLRMAGFRARSTIATVMPEISCFFGIVIRMYFFDHQPPHFHAYDGGAEAQFHIQPVGLLGGDLPPRALALVVEWARLRLHEAELAENWRRLHSDEPPQQIAPLE